MRVAHDPPYGSQHTPSAHRGCPHVTRAGQGVSFHTVEVAQHGSERTKPPTGLGVTVRGLDKV